MQQRKLRQQDAVTEHHAELASDAASQYAA